MMGYFPPMLSLSQTSGYAILALSCLDHAPGCWLLAKDIATRAGVPRPYLSKILHALGKAKLIRTKRGYRGGFVLARPARDIAVLDVVRAVDGDAWLGRCLLGMESCADDRACPTHAFWKTERAKIQARLARISLKDVADFERQRDTPYAYAPQRPAAHSRPARPRSTPAPGLRRSTEPITRAVRSRKRNM